MASNGLFESDASDTEEALMEATYRALCEYGYADLTISRIGDEFEKSTSLLYHHYDSKDDLLVAFLESMIEGFEEEFEQSDDGGADDRLQGIVDMIFELEVSEERREFTGAMLELRAQAVHDQAYREHFTRHDRVLRDGLASIIRDGAEEGVFRSDADPDRMAALLHATFNGARLERATTEESDTEPLERARDELQAVIDDRLLAEN